MSTEAPGSRTVPKARNPRTTAKFRREAWWQITFPMIVVTVLLLGCVVGLAFLGGSQPVSVVADYSLILLSIPALVLGLVALAVPIGLIYLIMLAMRYIPPYTFIAQKGMFAVQSKVQEIANSITGFIIGIRAVIGGIISYIREKGFIPESDQTKTEAAAEPAPRVE